MSNLKGFQISRGNIGANVAKQPTGTSILLISGNMDDISAQRDKVHTIYNVNDAVNLCGSNYSDAIPEEYILRHLKEFYRMAGEGTKLYVVFYPGLSMYNILTAVAPYGLTRAQKAILGTDGDARQLGIVVNGQTTSLLNGIEADVYNSIAPAQGLGEWCYENNMPLNIFLEGRYFGGNAATVANLRALPNGLSANYVSVVIGKDKTFQDEEGYAVDQADLGTVLGVTAAASISQNIGDNEAFNLSDPVKEIWLTAGLTDGVEISDHANQLQTLENKGYIFGVRYNGLAGIRLNNDHVCTPIVIDNDGNINEHTIAYSRTKNEAVRLLRSAYLPKVKTTWPVDKSTGKLSKGTIVALEEIGNAVFENMEARGEITFGKVTIDPNSDLLVDKVLRMSFKIVPMGSIGEIRGTINLKTKV